MLCYVLEYKVIFFINLLLINYIYWNLLCLLGTVSTQSAELTSRI